MADVFAIIILVLILSAASFYTIKSKKRGRKCVGCPLSSECGKNSCNH